MKKIGLLNFFYSNVNYGAVLQAAALEYFLKNKGFFVEHIDFSPKYKKPSYSKKNISRVFRRLIIILKGKITHFLFKNKTANRNKPLIISNENNVFDLFRNNWISTSTQKFFSNKDLRGCDHPYDIFIVGSDQVWRPKYTKEFIESYFLNFVKNDAKKIAYAASFGINEWEFSNEDKITYKIQKLISRFDAISVREDSGVSICKDVFSVDATHVLDPTLLIGRPFFDKICQEVNNKKVQSADIVYYLLDRNEKFQKILENFFNNMNFSIENIYFHQVEMNEVVKKFYYDIPTWLKKIKLSKTVITESFHCVCFAILFEKEFVCLYTKNRGDSRLESLLKLLCIEDRFLTTGEDSFYNINKIINKKIDYTVVKKRLHELRMVSESFLTNALLENSE